MPPEQAIRDWYNDTTSQPKPAPKATVQWRHIFTCWNAVELDFHRFGIDLADVLDTRDWRWFTLRVGDLLSDETSRLATTVKTLLTIEGEVPHV
ncbi:hypothetical protein GCM10027169_13170 [Gordonia jinhuaensis]|uniref:Uncharacterized protein n=1 Tax=Gordonia jinhuaensis TaxID=1517702 RepID=A0A916WPN6_9ACTN|nr:hypothetical protein [Gordonia jinhuaensis]GGB22599.1 hypothetical protein GCM10011489_08510 [Gordonia jinhuaensis]